MRIFIGYKGGISQFLIKTDKRVKINNTIGYKLDNKGFKSRSKDGLKGVFTRERKLKLKNLIVLIMSSCSSIQRDLDRFFKSMNNADFNIREVTKSAFSQARQKLNPWAFKRLNEVTVNGFYENNEVYT